jgi:hypothetical protein
MRAAYYERTGPADQVLLLGELPEPMPGLVKCGFGCSRPASIRQISNRAPAFEDRSCRFHASCRTATVWA